MADTEPKVDDVEQKHEESPDAVTETPAGDESPATESPTSGDDAGDGETPKAEAAEDAAKGDEAGKAGDEFNVHSYYTKRDRNTNDKPRERYTGTVAWFDPARGYGFIKVNSGEFEGVDAHVHGDNIVEDADGEDQTLEKDQKCSFFLLPRPPPKHEPNGDMRYTAKEVIPGEKAKKVKAKRYKGKCIFFNNAENKKFGFIRVDPCDDHPSGLEIFVHRESIHGKGRVLVEDQECDFEIQARDGMKPRAHNVHPGKAPPEDPNKDKWFNGTCVSWVKRDEPLRSFGFLRVEGENKDVMVPASRIEHANKVLVEGQKARFKIVKRKDRMNPDKPARESATEVRPGEVPVKQILHGVVKNFDEEKGYGFIERKGKADKDYFVHKDQIVGAEKTLEANQLVTFVAAPGQNQKKPRAVEVKPGKKAVEGKPAELKAEEISFEPYLPVHTDATATKKKSKKKSNLPNHVQIQQDDTLTADEKAAALKKDKNYRKRQRAKAAKNREDSPPAPVQKKPQPAPVAAPSPPAPQPAKKQKKSKSPKPKQQQAVAPPEPKPQPAPVQTNSKKKKAAKAQQQQQEEQRKQKEKEQQQKQQQQQQQAASVGNKKKPKRKNKLTAAQKRKAKADKQAQEEEDAIDALFEANKASRQAQRAGQESMFTVIYNYILSFCKAPPAKRKLKH